MGEEEVEEVEEVQEVKVVEDEESDAEVASQSAASIFGVDVSHDNVDVSAELARMRRKIQRLELANKALTAAASKEDTSADHASSTNSSGSRKGKGDVLVPREGGGKRVTQAGELRGEAYRDSEERRQLQ